MEIDMEIRPDRNLAYFRLRGTVVTRIAEQAFVDYVSHPLFDTRLTLLTNTVGLTGVESTFLQIMGAVIRQRKTFAVYSSPVLSVIHTKNETAFGVARILQQVAEPITQFRFQLTTSQSEALAAAGQAETCFDALDSLLGLPPQSTTAK